MVSFLGLIRKGEIRTFVACQRDESKDKRCWMDCGKGLDISGKKMTDKGRVMQVQEGVTDVILMVCIY